GVRENLLSQTLRRVLMPTEPSTQYRPLQTMGGLTLQRCQCRGASAGRAPDEQHFSFSVSLVDRGVFSYRNARADAGLGPGWLMLGNEREAYVCPHEQGGGDDCIVLDLDAQTYDAMQSALGQVGGPFARPALPPLPRVAALLKSLVASGEDGF